MIEGMDDVGRFNVTGEFDDEKNNEFIFKPIRKLLS
jgi:hypothetical protein